MEKIKLNASELHFQSMEAVDSYMGIAEYKIDAQFGDGYAKKHPELVGMFVLACAIEFNLSFLSAVLQDIDDAIIAGCHEVADAIDAIGETP